MWNHRGHKSKKKYCIACVIVDNVTKKTLHFQGPIHLCQIYPRHFLKSKLYFCKSPKASSMSLSQTPQNTSRGPTPHGRKSSQRHWMEFDLVKDSESALNPLWYIWSLNWKRLANIFTWTVYIWFLALMEPYSQGQMHVWTIEKNRRKREIGDKITW